MATSTSTLTGPTEEIDPQEVQRFINKARQLPLRVLALRDTFPDATQNIAQIAENANPEDPELLDVEIAAIKVRCAAHSGFVCFQSLVGFGGHVGARARVARVQMPMSALGEHKCLP